ncbi:MAG: hypothetical protein KDI75_00750 [Xanthomonadales bacterium]|nr:hypothetical protein [Xanthomonadales bacterium]
MNWGLLILGGFLIALLAQLVGAIMAFRGGAQEGVLSLLVPGYVLFALKRSGGYRLFVGIYFAGIASVAAGTIALS